MKTFPSTSSPDEASCPAPPWWRRRRTWAWLGLTVTALACVAHPPWASQEAGARPYTRCGAFEFRVRDDAELKQAQLLMVEAAIDMGLRFETGLPRAGFQLSIGGTGYPMVFRLSSQDGPWTDKYWLGAEHLAGGPAQPPPPGAPSHWKPYLPTAECLKENGLKFAALRQRFAARWAVRDGDPKGFLPLRSASAPAAGGRQMR